MIRTSVQIALRIATPISCTPIQYMEVFSDGTHFLKSLVICDLRFESQIGIAVQSPDLEQLVQACPGWLQDDGGGWGEFGEGCR